MAVVCADSAVHACGHLQVHRADEATQLDQRRLLLTLDQHSRVMAVNSGATRALFGFNPALLVSKRLADFVDVFEAWSSKYGQDTSLLALLAKVKSALLCLNIALLH